MTQIFKLVKPVCAVLSSGEELFHQGYELFLLGFCEVIWISPSLHGQFIVAQPPFLPIIVFINDWRGLETFTIEDMGRDQLLPAASVETTCKRRHDLCVVETIMLREDALCSERGQGRAECNLHRLVEGQVVQGYIKVLEQIYNGHAVLGIHTECDYVARVDSFGQFYLMYQFDSLVKCHQTLAAGQVLFDALEVTLHALAVCLVRSQIPSR